MLKDLPARFERFHLANPDVYRLFVRFSLEVARRGHKRFSAYSVMHRIRWYTSVDTRGDSFKINNNWGPFYARLFHADHPEHSDLFELRTAIADLMDTPPELPEKPPPPHVGAGQMMLRL